MVHFEENDRVVVTGCNYRGNTIGQHGTVMNIYWHDTESKIAVKLDTKSNEKSQYGYFYYSPNQLKKEKSTMGKTKMDGKYCIARVCFLDGDKSIDCACYEADVDVNDKVLIKTASHGFAVATVTTFVENKGQDIYREVICKLSFDAYEKRIEQRIHRAELMKQMAKRAEELKELTLFETLAKADPGMAELLKEYKETEI